MKKLVFACASLVLLSAHAQKPDSQKDVIKKTAKFTGKVFAFEMGDYTHVQIRNMKGAEFSYFIGSQPGLDLFLAVNANKEGTFTVQFVNSYIHEAGGRIDIERISDAQFGKQTYKAWYKAERKKMTHDQIQDKYWPMLEKLLPKEGQ